MSKEKICQAGSHAGLVGCRCYGCSYDVATKSTAPKEHCGHSCCDTDPSEQIATLRQENEELQKELVSRAHEDRYMEQQDVLIAKQEVTIKQYKAVVDAARELGCICCDQCPWFSEHVKGNTSNMPCEQVKVALKDLDNLKQEPEEKHYLEEGLMDA